MISEAPETPSGWPLGLEIVNARLRVAESLLTTAVIEPYSLRMFSTSFSSFSSSNLDTEINQSTVSFFQDHSISLGRLIGMRPQDQRGFYLSKSVRFEEHHGTPVRNMHQDITREHGFDISQRICIPLLLGVLVKIRSKSNTQA